MGYKVIGTTVYLTRGDTLRLKVNIMQEQPDGTKEEYIPQEGDAVRFAVKKDIYKGVKYTELEDVDPLIIKSIPIDTLILELEPGDTKGLPFGMYLYDVELTMADGTVDTFITDAKFWLKVEVH